MTPENDQEEREMKTMTPFRSVDHDGLFSFKGPASVMSALSFGSLLSLLSVS